MEEKTGMWESSNIKGSEMGSDDFLIKASYWETQQCDIKCVFIEFYVHSAFIHFYLYDLMNCYMLF